MDAICHLRADSDLRESKADVVTEFVEVLVLPLCDSVHHLVMHVLSVND